MPLSFRNCNGVYNLIELTFSIHLQSLCPRLAVAVGDCGYNGGIFGESYESLGEIGKIIPVYVYAVAHQHLLLYYSERYK